MTDELKVVTDEPVPHEWVDEPGTVPPKKWCAKCHRRYWLTPTAERLGVRIEGICLPRD